MDIRFVLSIDLEENQWKSQALLIDHEIISMVSFELSSRVGALMT